MHKQNVLLEQCNKQSTMNFNILCMLLVQLKEQSRVTSSRKHSRNEDAADGDEPDEDGANSKKMKLTASSPSSPTWSLVKHMLTPGLSANVFPQPNSSVGLLFAQHVAAHSPYSPIPFDSDRDLEAERNMYFAARL